jgi:hypothetical protein
MLISSSEDREPTGSVSDGIRKRYANFVCMIEVRGQRKEAKKKEKQADLEMGHAVYNMKGGR